MKTLQIEKKHYSLLSNIFKPIVINDIAEKGYSKYLSEICINSGLIEKIDTSMTLSQFFDWLYKLLFKNYRNEYIYKNIIRNSFIKNISHAYGI